MGFADNIRRIRLSRGMTQAEFAKVLGVTQVGVHGWESGARRPNTESIRSICKALNVSADELLDLPKRGYELSGAEREIIGIYRSLDTFGKEAVEIICRHESDRVLHGSSVVADKKQTVGERFIPRYVSSAAAGLAAPMDEAEAEMMLVDDGVPDGADYAVVINGRSMEPYILDGSTVFVQKTDELQTGDIGIFSVDGAAVCKMLYETGLGDIYLVSANPDERGSNVFIPHDSSDTVVCLGRVLLKKPRILPDYFNDSL